MTIDPDNAERLRKLAKRLRLPFKRVLNDALRRGLCGTAEKAESPFAEKTEPPFVVKARPMRLKAGVDLMRVSH